MYTHNFSTQKDEVEHKFEASLGYKKKQANKPLSLAASLMSTLSNIGVIPTCSLIEILPTY